MNHNYDDLNKQLVMSHNEDLYWSSTTVMAGHVATWGIQGIHIQFWWGNLLVNKKDMGR
jgi:hypothetical protein